MAITFPASPVNGQTHTENGQIFVFDSTRGYWLLKKQDQIVASTSRSTFVATAGQTVHTVNYDPSASVIVSVNGVMLNPQDITSTNGTSIIFDTALALSDEVDIVFHQPTASNLIRQDISDPMATESYVQTYVTNNSSVGVTTVADMAALIALTGMANGDQALVTANNNLFIYSGSGWYKIATVQNDSPSAITGVSGTYELAVDGTATVITAVSTDPEGFPLTWSYSASGIGSIATVSQSDNVFTITPSTTEENAGTFTLTINATDGVNGAVSTTTNLTLEFIVIVTNSRYTTLLATATDTSDNNNITDASTNNHTITVSGDAHAGTFSPYRSGGYSLEFNGSNSRIGIQSSNVQIGTSAFTMEFWLYSRAHSGSISSKYSASNSYGYFLISTTSSDGLRCRTRSSGGTQKYVNSGSGSYNLNQWNHCIFQRDANGNLTSYLNGTKYTGENDGSTNLSATELGLGVFNYTGYEGWLDGYIRDFKLTIGTSALRTASTITVPTEPLASDSNTTAFLGHLPYFGDGSSSPNTVVSSNASTAPFSPHDYDKYLAADHGGSVYFDGSGDYLNTTATQIIPSTSFTVTAWVYFEDTTQNAVWGQGISGHSGRCGVSLDNGTWYAQIGNDVIGQSTTPSIKEWLFTDLQWDGSTLKFFVNGSLIGSVSTSNSPTNSALYIGDLGSSWTTTYPLNGYVSDLKVVSGTPSGSSIVPTAPLSSSGTSLHIKGTDASIIDKSQGANIKLVGTTTGSTTQVKFADTKSIYSDGTAGNHLSIPADDSIFSKDYTVEFWMYPTQDTNISMPFSKGVGLQFYHQSGNIAAALSWNNSSYSYNGNFGSITTNAWSHISLVRDSSASTYKFYINGTLEDTLSSASNINTGSSDWIIGAFLTSGNYAFEGYIQDVRVTEGLARYTTSFTPPTASLEG
jgi:hypothetical protein